MNRRWSFCPEFQEAEVKLRLFWRADASPSLPGLFGSMFAQEMHAPESGRFPPGWDETNP